MAPGGIKAKNVALPGDAHVVWKQGHDAGVRDVVAWLRGIPQDWIEDWGLNATGEIADLLDSGLWMFDGAGPSESEETKG